MHGSVEDTKLSTNKQLSLSYTAIPRSLNRTLTLIGVVFVPVTIVVVESGGVVEFIDPCIEIKA